MEIIWQAYLSEFPRFLDSFEEFATKMSGNIPPHPECSRCPHHGRRNPEGLE